MYVLWRFVINKKQDQKQKSIALVMALTDILHWFTDVIVHTPDFPLIFGTPKFGFALWQNKWTSFLVEGFLLMIGLWH